MDTGTIAMIITAVLALLGVLGYLSKTMKVTKALKESVDVATAGLMALSDGKVTPEEIEKFKKELAEAKAAWKS